MESVTADEWQALEALEMAAIARSQVQIVSFVNIICIDKCNAKC